MKDPDQPVVVAEAKTVAAASILCHLLEEAGVSARIEDSHMSTLYSSYLERAFGGVKVVVRAGQAKQAADVLRSAREEPAPRALSDKSVLVDRALAAALFGLIPPFIVVTFLLLIFAARAPGEWTARSRRRAWTSAAIATVFLGIWIYVFPDVVG